MDGWMDGWMDCIVEELFKYPQVHVHLTSGVCEVCGEVQPGRQLPECATLCEDSFAQCLAFWEFLRNKKLLGAPGIATRSDRTLRTGQTKERESSGTSDGVSMVFRCTNFRGVAAGIHRQHSTFVDEVDEVNHRSYTNAALV